MDNLTSTRMNDTNYIMPNTNAMITGVLNGVIFLVGVSGNSLIILSVVSSKKLQTSTNAFIVSLAVTDLMTCASNAVYVVVKWNKVYSVALETTCTIVAPIATASVACSLLTLAVIALNRYILIASYRRLYSFVFQPKLIVLWITLMWLISLSVIFLPPFVFDFGQFGFDRGTHTCLSLPEHPKTKSYMLLTVVVFYPLPLLTIIFCYVGIFIRIFRHSRRLNASRAHPQSTDSSSHRLTNK